MDHYKTNNMNEIKKTDRDFEVEYTDKSDELYAEEQGKREMSPEVRNLFTIWNAITEVNQERDRANEQGSKMNDALAQIKVKGLVVYESLEHLLNDLLLVPEKGAIKQIQEIAEKLSRTISTGAYLQIKGEE